MEKADPRVSVTKISKDRADRSVEGQASRFEESVRRLNEGDIRDLLVGIDDLKSELRQKKKELFPASISSSEDLEEIQNELKELDETEKILDEWMSVFNRSADDIKKFMRKLTNIAIDHQYFECDVYSFYVRISGLLYFQRIPSAIR